MGGMSSGSVRRLHARLALGFTLLSASAGLGACGLFGAEFTSVDGAGGGATSSASEGSTVGAGGADATATSASSGGAGGMEMIEPCAEPDLVACYRFDGDAVDGSGNGNSATALNVGYGPGVDGEAIALSPQSLVQAPNGPTWSLTSYTIEAWVRPDTLPEGDARAGILDHDTRYALFLYGSGVRCGTGGSSVYGPQIPAQTWTHLACTHDGSTMRVYVNGVEEAAKAASPLDGMTVGAVITIGSNAPGGDPFNGAIDTLRVFRSARTAEQICAAAGGAGC